MGAARGRHGRQGRWRGTEDVAQGGVQPWLAIDDRHRLAERAILVSAAKVPAALVAAEGRAGDPPRLLLSLKVAVHRGAERVDLARVEDAAKHHEALSPVQCLNGVVVVHALRMYGAGGRRAGNDGIRRWPRVGLWLDVPQHPSVVVAAARSLRRRRVCDRRLRRSSKFHAVTDWTEKWIS